MSYRIKGTNTKCREQSPVEKRAHVLAQELHLTSEQRHDLARMLIDVDPDSDGSWKNLDTRQFSELVTMMEGSIYVMAMFAQQGRCFCGSLQNR